MAGSVACRCLANMRTALSRIAHHRGRVPAVKAPTSTLGEPRNSWADRKCRSDQGVFSLPPVVHLWAPGFLRRGVALD